MNDSRLQAWFDEHPGIQLTVMKCEKCGLYFEPSLGHDCEVSMTEEEIINNFLDWFFNQEVYGMDREKGCLLVGRDERYVKALDVYRKEKEER